MKTDRSAFLRLLTLLLATLLAVAAAGQQPPTGVSPGTAATAQPSETPRVQQPEPIPNQKNEPPQAEIKISRQEAQELFRSVDEILQFVSKDTGLPIKHSVKRKLASRDEVEKFIEERMKDDEDSRRLQRSEVVLKKFGFLPENFALKTFLVGLLKEQVAGFYNTKDKTVYLLDWVEPEAQKPVLAHELTHALQDQNFNLDKWAKAVHGGKPGTAENLMEDERVAARQAVSEGQAMVSLVDYMLAGTGQSVSTNPSIADAVIAGMETSGQTPLYTKAPMFLKALLVFPYQFGLRFERDVLDAEGKQGAFAGAFRNPPQDTHEIMDPTAYVKDQSVPLLPVPGFEAAAGKEYEKYDISVMGQFDVWLLAKQYAGQNEADALSPKWHGGYYYAALKPGTKTAKGSETVPASSLALAYLSKWVNADSAAQFAGMYAAYLPKRYGKLTETGAAGPTDSGTMDVPGLGAQVKVEVAKRLTGMHTWSTDQGDVSIETRGDQVLIVEGFDPDAALRLRQAVFADGQSSMHE